MAGVNKVILVGHLGRDPELRQVGGGQKATFTMATSRTGKDKQGQRTEFTQWHRVVVWGALAETVQRFTNKGSQVYVEGSLETREYEQNGEKQRVTEVNARLVEFLDKRGAGGGEPQRERGGQAPSRGGFGDDYGRDMSEDVPF